MFDPVLVDSDAFRPPPVSWLRRADSNFPCELADLLDDYEYSSDPWKLVDNCGSARIVRNMDTDNSWHYDGYCRYAKGYDLSMIGRNDADSEENDRGDRWLNNCHEAMNYTLLSIRPHQLPNAPSPSLYINPSLPPPSLLQRRSGTPAPFPHKLQPPYPALAHHSPEAKHRQPNRSRPTQ
jgi:hypothetical protein